MSQDKKATWENLSRLLNSSGTRVLRIRGNKYVLFSDMHLGDGGKADDFHRNEKALERALDYYRLFGYRLILLGDIEEFWQFDVEQIRDRYNHTIYQKIRQFGDENIFRIWGNHDSEWRAYDDPATTKQEKPMGAPEALLIGDSDRGVCVLLLHGHQGSTESDRASWFSRFWVRLFKNVESAASWLKLYGHQSAAHSQIAKDYERIFYSWAKKNKIIVICGHSHRAIFASRSYIEKLEEQIRQLQWQVLHNKSLTNQQRNWKIGEIRKKTIELGGEELKNRRIDPTEPGRKPRPCYFNTGCTLYTDGITAIEIADDEIRLVKWHRRVKKGNEREVYDEGKLSEFIGIDRRALQQQYYQVPKGRLP